MGCEDFLEVNDPFGQINTPEVFEDEATATAAVTSLYAKLRDEVLLTGTTQGLTALMGIYSDELDFYGLGAEPMDSFYQHYIFSDDPIVEGIWNGSYSLIYMGNAILESLDKSDKIGPDIKKQLRGETLFIRALTYSYLVNLFGDIPYATTTDFGLNSMLSRMPASEVYENIIMDLQEAKGLLGANYISSERTRANQMVVASLLARVYIFTEQWDLAALEATTIINNTSVFNLEVDVANEFLKESTSAILQFKPKSEGENTQEASLFLFESGPPPLVALNPQLYEGMEPNDGRKEHWIGVVTDGSETWYFPNKYKIEANTGTSIEYSVVLRLSEQFLIRAEARAKLGNLSGALDDLNVIRNRAGLMDSEATTESGILDAISTERYHELFSEFGHRWFDIKRLGLANDILAPIKPGWKPTDLLLPIPENELLMNPKLEPQNPGY
ncbi:RagB/SusD family nutrient uptake outer membrane protein [Aequorivita antarctica]|uniref:RagB/SusD family nutrient uptake outer membrane protein n=2 Tax=Aequorivita antarctica TaxID=153266 RepID=A0A5C6Z045_9FLAO|nr:RagB/SusD family nutrient uptake outer membrane protein [Aequorivita antarctica]